MTKKSRKSERKLKVADEKKKKQLLKSNNKHLKDIKKGKIEDITKTIERLDLNTQQGHDNNLIQCTVTHSKRPSPRISSSYNVHPITGELIIFGGEFYDGHEAKCFNDLFKWNIERNEWKKVIVDSNKIQKDAYSGGPKPRCSHQAIIFGEYLFVHGGEFSTEQQFYHFKDMWRLNLKNYFWEEVKFTGVAPSPRSGHRMVVWRHFFVVFGGFHDTIKETQYFNDIYIFNTKSLHWDKIDSSRYETLPSPRSGVQMVLCPNSDKIFIYGGYSKIKDNSKNSIGKTHTDSWLLDMKPYLSDRKNPVWERLNRKGNPPSPRSGSSITSYKNQCLLFGGVFDKEDNTGLNLNSIFYNDLFTFDFNSKRWYEIHMLNKNSEDAITSPILEMQNMKEENDKLTGDSYHIDSENLDSKILEAAKSPTSESLVTSKSTNLNKSTIASTKTSVDSKLSKSCLISKIDDNTLDLNCCKNINDIYVESSFPIPRINCGMFTKGNCVYIFGGLFELGKKIITLDDCWSLNILKKDRWNCIIPPSLDPTIFNDLESESESELDLSSEEETVVSSDDSEFSWVSSDSVSEGSHLRDKSRTFTRKAMQELTKNYELDDSNKTPLVNESIGNFFTRTKEFWIKLFRESNSEVLTEKEISRNAFTLAYERVKRIKPFLELIRKEDFNQLSNE